MQHLILHPGTIEVEVDADGLVLDLGGIGKGYAVDKMADSLREWSIESAMIHGGQSTILAIGAPGGSDAWTVELRNPEAGQDSLEKITLKNQAISGSGVDIEAPHIAAHHAIAAWALAPNPATADALSTAFIVMEPEEIELICRNNPQYSAALIEPDKTRETLRYFGAWPRA